MKVYRGALAAVAWTAIVLQYWLGLHDKSGAAFVDTAINYSSYFTILSNLMVALTLTVPLVAPDSAAGRLFERPSVRAATAVYIIITGLIYFFLLRGAWSPTGLQLAVDVALHDVIPILYVLDWLVFAPKGSLRRIHALWWLAFPALFGVYTLIHGALSGFYPYPFVDVSRRGYAAVIFTMVVFMGGYFALGLILVIIDGALAARSRAAAAASKA